LGLPDFYGFVSVGLMSSVAGAIPAFKAVVRDARRALINPLLVILISAAAIFGARAADVTGQVTGSTSQGYGRIIFTFSEEIKTTVEVSNGIVVISFSKPVSVATEKLGERLTGYVQAVRRDPDSGAVRLALGRKVTVNMMEAAEKVFIDFLPDDWAGLPPAIPQEIVDDLAKRAREAERNVQMNRNAPRKTWAPVKLRFATAPTFARFAFEMAEPITTSTTREGQELRIGFDAPVKIDFGEAKAKLPSTVVGLEAEYEMEMTTVKLVLAPDAGIRSFRDDGAFVVDVAPSTIAPLKAIEGKNQNTAPELPAVGRAPESKMDSDAPKELAAIEPEPVEPAAQPVSQQSPMTVTVPAVSVDAKKTEAMPPAMDSKPADEPVLATVSRHTGKFSITLPFGEQTSGAIFRRNDVVWIVLDTMRPLNLADLANDTSRMIRSFEQSTLQNGQVIKLKLDRNRLTSMESDGQSWVVNVGDAVLSPSRPLPARRVFIAENRSGLFVPLASPSRVHTLSDPDIGDNLLVVTALPPARGMVRGQDFVEFRALESAHGLVLMSKADDLTIDLAVEGVTLTRPNGLVVSEMTNVSQPLAEKKTNYDRHAMPLDPETWQTERDSNFIDRQVELSQAVAETPVARRGEKRVALARFYLSKNLAAEALGTIEASATEEMQSSNTAFGLLRAVAELKMNRNENALRDLAKPEFVGLPQATLLRVSALTGLTRWAQAREQFVAGHDAIADLPIELQRMVLMDAMRAAIEVRDFAEASRIRHEFESVGTPANLAPILAVLTARITQGIGRTDQAASDFAEVALGTDGPAMAEARLRLIQMRVAQGDMDRPKAIEALEILSFAWRGNETEIETMFMLGRLYVAEARYREAFRQLDAAQLTFADNEITRVFQTEMAAVFEDLFLANKADSLPAIDSLAIYYDFSKLTPIGRRGDELIRRLADRLVSVDLLDQAAELLDHQVEFRLAGAAKAQVASKLAWIHLMNHKPTLAIKVLAGSRTRDLPQDLRDQRLLLEARALSETGRVDPGIELIAEISGSESDRLRADILWNAKRWREAGDALEKLLADRWKQEAALNEIERQDVLRAAIAFALGNETIGLTRLRDRYSAKMIEGPERNAFDIVASSIGKNPKALSDVAKTLSAVDSLNLFLRLYQARFPDKPLPEPTTTSSATPRVSAR
jgi:hypothetical protein